MKDSGESAIEILKQHLEYGNKHSRQDWVRVNDYVFKRHIIAAMEEYASQKLEDYRRLSSKEDRGWVSVKERLPELCVSVLAYDPTDGRMYGVDYWNGKTWGDFNNTPPTVTHWQPLPTSPPKEE